MTNIDRKTIQLFEEKTGNEFENLEALESHLSGRFSDILDSSEDAQYAYDELNDELDGLLGAHFCYTLSEDGETWSVETGEAFEESRLSEYLADFNDVYESNHDSIDDMTSTLERRVSKDMSNAGIDAKNALRLILENDLFRPGLFAIIGADALPRIQHVN